MEPAETHPESELPDPVQRRRSRPSFQVSELGTLLLSALLAFTIWLIAVNQENPLLVQQFELPIPLTVLGMEDGLEVVQDLSAESVLLELRAPRTSWESMRVDDFRATLDLTGLGTGDHVVSVKVTRRDPQVAVLTVQRSEYTVTIDQHVQKEIPVQVEIMDGAAFGYEWQQPIYTPMTVTVSGPATQVSQVVRARAEIYLRGAKSQIERTQQLVPIDAQSRAVERVAVPAPGKVQIVVPVEQWPGRKEVAVRVKLTGPPANGYRLSAVRAEPSTVPLLESMNEDDVFAILDLNGLVAGTHIVEPAILSPDGIIRDAVIPETVEVVVKQRALNGLADPQAATPSPTISSPTTSSPATPAVLTPAAP